MKFECPECGKRLRVRDDCGRDRTRCPNCKNVIDVPESTSRNEEFPEAESAFEEPFALSGFDFASPLVVRKLAVACDCLGV